MGPRHRCRMGCGRRLLGFVFPSFAKGCRFESYLRSQFFISCLGVVFPSCFVVLAWFDTRSFGSTPKTGADPNPKLSYEHNTFTRSL